MERYVHKAPIVTLSAVDKAGLWDVRADGEVIGQVQETWEGTTARIVAYEGYAFPTRWAAAYALAYGHEFAASEMRMVGY